MSLTPTEWATIFTPVISFIGILASIIYTWIKTRIKPAEFLFFDVHVSKLYEGKRDDGTYGHCLLKYYILNTGDKVGFVKLSRAELKIKTSDKIIEVIEPEFIDPLKVPLESGRHSQRNFTFISSLDLLEGWKEGYLLIEGLFYNHKGKTKNIKQEFVGSSQVEEVWVEIRTKD